MDRTCWTYSIHEHYLHLVGAAVDDPGPGLLSVGLHNAAQVGGLVRYMLLNSSNKL